MSTYDESPEREPLDSEEAEDTGFAGGGGPASVIYGENDEEVDRAGEEMLEAPDEE